MKVHELLRTGVKVIEPARGEARTAFRQLDRLFVEGADFGVAELQQFAHAVITTFGGEAHLEGRSSVPIRNNKTNQVFVFSTRNRFPDPQMVVEKGNVTETIHAGSDGSFSSLATITRSQRFSSALTDEVVQMPQQTIRFGPRPLEARKVQRACRRLFDILLTAL